jgi:hypothetical protein
MSESLNPNLRKGDWLYVPPAKQFGLEEPQIEPEPEHCAYCPKPIKRKNCRSKTCGSENCLQQHRNKLQRKYDTAWREEQKVKQGRKLANG